MGRYLRRPPLSQTRRGGRVGEGVSVSLDPAGPSYSRCWGRCCGLLSYDSGLVELPLGVVGLGEVLVPKVCSGHQFRPEG